MTKITDIIDLVTKVFGLLGVLASTGLFLVYLFGVPGVPWSELSLRLKPSGGEGIAGLSANGLVQLDRRVQVSIRAHTSYAPTGPEGGLFFSKLSINGRSLAVEGSPVPGSPNWCNRDNFQVVTKAPGKFQRFSLLVICSIPRVDNGTLIVEAEAKHIGPGERLSVVDGAIKPDISINAIVERDIFDRILGYSK